MILTEEDAKKKHCPNIGFGENDSVPFCIASACMMWEWIETHMPGDEQKTGRCGLCR